MTTELNTQNPDFITYKHEELLFSLLGGIRLEGLDRQRQVQYMAGHKWIGSTEHYQVQELDGLIDMLGKHHPFS